MDPIATARYGLMAATQRFEASAVEISKLGGDESVDLGKEMVEMVQAKAAFSANISVIKFARDMWDDLLNLQSK